MTAQESYRIVSARERLVWSHLGLPPSLRERFQGDILLLLANTRENPKIAGAFLAEVAGASCSHRAVIVQSSSRIHLGVLISY